MMDEADEDIWSVRRVARDALTLFLPAVVAVGAGFYALDWQDRRRIEDDLRTAERSRVTQATVNLEKQFGGVVVDLMVLSENQHLKDYLEDSSSADRAAFESEFLTFLRLKRTFDQVRFLDGWGHEIVRINFNDGAPAPATTLQDKSTRYYFSDAIGAVAGMTYVSPLDLNIERGRIEMPYKPMIRLATPVFDRNGEKGGVVVLNYFGQLLLDEIAASFVDGSARPLMLNQDGACLSCDDPVLDWSFMFEGRASFADRNPDLWRRMESDEGQFMHDGALYTYTTVYPRMMAQGPGAPDGGSPAAGAHPEARSDAWKVASRMSAAKVDEALNRNVTNYVPLFGLTVLALALLQLLVTRRRANARMAERQAALQAHSSALQNEIEERRQLEDQLRQALADTQLANRAKDQFLETMSHELRTPLNAIIGFAEILLSDNPAFQDEDKRRRYIEDILMSARELLDEISDILDAAAIERNSMTYRDEVLNVETLIQSAARLVEQKARAKNVRVAVTVPVGVAGLYGDAKRIKQALYNLLANAVHFSREGGGVDVFVESDRGLDIVVRDHGAGMSDDVLKLIGKPFAQSASGLSDRSESAGLGLYLARAFVARHQGGLDIFSTVDQGTTVRMHFPPERLR